MKSKGKYYWKFKSLIPIVLSEQRECVVCGSKKNLNIHHLVHCQSFEKKYSDKNNLVVMCRDCHREYHNNFSKSTPYTLFMYARIKNLRREEYYKEQIKDLKLERIGYLDLINWLLQMDGE